MKRLELNVPTFGFAVATRAMIGAGLGLLFSDRIARKRRRAIGFTLLGIGAASTVPVVRALIRGQKQTAF